MCVVVSRLSGVSEGVDGVSSVCYNICHKDDILLIYFVG